jgi:hypothetical protein
MSPTILPRRRVLLAAAACLSFAGLGLAACGKVGSPRPPEDVDPRYPRFYPADRRHPEDQPATTQPPLQQPDDAFSPGGNQPPPDPYYPR